MSKLRVVKVVAVSGIPGRPAKIGDSSFDSLAWSISAIDSRNFTSRCRKWK
jgi:hypothetical protein